MLKEIKVQIDGKEFIAKRNNKALMFYEKYTQTSIEDIKGTLTDMLTLFYCVLSTNNLEFVYSFDDFCELVDEYPKSFKDFQAYLIELQFENIENTIVEEEEPVKKKVTRKQK